ncbi:cob(I)yrinic acid a,c-diamide adenosyltransferase [Clostridium massiliamazoniense]|uniref:cob(I)yrinic acid a,c-diamide adenosyltransferase n=1 Tax=Clostridium massiliamazoniense TaxID=1347366 RepID=UPI0006D84C32|nr:cob(I)yrinic acid a,c-diamide adenosyltransferase [Clostridium massiliamazoniense]
MEKGYIQIYTGESKGKTTAAMGLAIRAAGSGLKVCIVQFLKAWKTSELNSLEKIDNIDVFRFQTIKKFTWELNESERKQIEEETKKAYNFILNVFKEKKYDVVIVDEIMGALGAKLLTEQEVLELMDKKPDTVELVMTGRYPTEAIINKADLVTEMNVVKHYFNEGVQARLGIEF